MIDHRVVAAATRRPAQVVGDGVSDLRALIERHSKRRAAATHGESRIPLDAETERCVQAAGYGFDSVLPDGKLLSVRKTANLHTGGTIHDVTAELHPLLRAMAEKASRLLDIPVVGLDLMVPAVDAPEYAVIEANERPGLANHQPQPTVERFVDLLFPQTCRGATPKRTSDDRQAIPARNIEATARDAEPVRHDRRRRQTGLRDPRRDRHRYKLTRRGAIRAILPGTARSPRRAIAAHLDTLGAMVKALKPNGRLEIVPIGFWSSRFAEGARMTVYSDNGNYRGTGLPLKASGHTFNKEIDSQPVDWKQVELRLDERCASVNDLMRLGVRVGDTIAVDPEPNSARTASSPHAISTTRPGSRRCSPPPKRPGAAAAACRSMCCCYSRSPRRSASAPRISCTATTSPR